MLDAFLFWGSLVLLGLLFVGVSLDMVLTVLDIRCKRRDEESFRQVDGEQ